MQFVSQRYQSLSDKFLRRMGKCRTIYVTICNDFVICGALGHATCFEIPLTKGEFLIGAGGTRDLGLAYEPKL